MKELISSVVLGLSLILSYGANATAPVSTNVVQLDKSATLFENADLRSNQFEVEAGQSLLLTDEAENGFRKAKLLSTDGSEVQLVGFVKSGVQSSHKFRKSQKLPAGWCYPNYPLPKGCMWTVSPMCVPGDCPIRSFDGLPRSH